MFDDFISEVECAVYRTRIFVRQHSSELRDLAINLRRKAEDPSSGVCQNPFLKKQWNMDVKTLYRQAERFQTFLNLNKLAVAKVCVV